jgi:threonine dehydrogenase-like Zn-dependent dehydrogenase
MKGYVFAEPNRAEWRELPVPQAGPFGAVVRPHIVAPCTTDMHLLQTFSIPWLKEKVMGHEMAGIVAEVGPEVRDFAVGDRVVVSACLPDWRTLEAQNKRPKSADTAIYAKDSDELGGSFSEFYRVVDADMTLAHIPEEVSWEQAVMLTDMGTTAIEAVGLMDIGFGDSVAIIGIGPVGLMAVAAVAIRGAARIFAVGSRQVCFDVARQFGATDMVDYRQGDYTARVLELNGGEVDAVLVAGGPSQGISNGLRMVVKGGVVANVAGFLDEVETVIPHDVWGHGYFDKTLRTVQTSGGRLVLEKLCCLVKYGRLHPEKLVTHRFYGMDKIPDAMQLLLENNREVIKPVVYYEAD